MKSTKKIKCPERLSYEDDGYLSEFRRINGIEVELKVYLFTAPHKYLTVAIDEKNALFNYNIFLERNGKAKSKDGKLKVSFAEIPRDKWHTRIEYCGENMSIDEIVAIFKAEYEQFILYVLKLTDKSKLISK